MENIMTGIERKTLKSTIKHLKVSIHYKAHEIEVNRIRMSHKRDEIKKLEHDIQGEKDKTKKKRLITKKLMAQSNIKTREAKEKRLMQELENFKQQLKDALSSQRSA